MNVRKGQGHTLALAAVLTMFIIITGIGFFVLVKVVGGSYEIRNAVDSGTLGIAKQASVDPSVSLSKKAIEQSFAGLIDPDKGGFNLQSYNAAVGQALLVMLNAEADGSQKAIANAKLSLQAVEGAGGIGKRLQDGLAEKQPSAGDWAATSFQATANGNSLRMLGALGGTPTLAWTPSAQSYAVAYVGQDGVDSGSNVILPSDAVLKKMMPLSDYTLDKRVSWPHGATTKEGKDKYLTGYNKLDVPHVGSIFAVSLSATQQPHLISTHTFGPQAAQPGIAQGLIIPPNAFRAIAVSKDARTNLTVEAASNSIAATLPLSHPTHPLAIPRGYLIIDNSGDGSDSSNHGALPQNTVVAAAFYGTSAGVTVDSPGSGLFSNNGAVERWMKYNYDVKKGIPSAQPSMDGLYTALGNEASLAQAITITPKASAGGCHCNDLNSDPLALGYQPPCATYIPSFNHAYFPNSGPQLDFSGAQLTAGEWAKMQLWDHHPNSGWLLLPEKTTGTRLYPPPPHCPMLGQEAPYCGSSSITLLYDTPVQTALGYSNPNVPGQVTKDGTLVELMAQINPLGALELSRFLDNRIRQIKPTASDAEVLAVLGTKLKIRSKYYLYMNQTSGKLVMETQAPPWLDPNFGTVADGKPKVFPGMPFNLVPTLINPHHDFNIHDAPFLDWSLYPPDPSFDKTSLAIDRLTGAFTPASGAYNLLGTISFEEKIRNVGLPTVFYNPN